ncbi:MAG: type II toxin-antitoxin system ParD family antitoxin [Nitriliruptoraceae bacterium]
MERSSLSTVDRTQAEVVLVHVSLTPELEQLIEERVRRGRCTSASEVVREALRLLQDRDELLVREAVDRSVSRMRLTVDGV